MCTSMDVIYVLHIILICLNVYTDDQLTLMACIQHYIHVSSSVTFVECPSHLNCNLKFTMPQSSGLAIFVPTTTEIHKPITLPVLRMRAPGNVIQCSSAWK